MKVDNMYEYDDHSLPPLLTQIPPNSLTLLTITRPNALNPAFGVPRLRIVAPLLKLWVKNTSLFAGQGY